MNAGELGTVRLQETPQRRSPRRELELPIRIFATDFRGRDFVEDSATVLISRHGAKIRLTRGLIPEQEIRILCQGTHREALFRVVERAGEATNNAYFWGVECLDPGKDIWQDGTLKPASTSGSRPAPPAGPEQARKPLPPKDSKACSKESSPAQTTLRCPECGMTELFDLSATQIQAIMRLKGLVRACPACGATRLWKPVGR